MKNSYASGLDIEVKNGVRANGVGGLVGYVETFGSCIKRLLPRNDQYRFGGTGGIVGAGSSDISEAVSLTDITSSTGDLGGILGIATDNVRLMMSSRSETSPEVVPISTVSTEIYVVLHSVQSQNGAAYSGQIVGTELPSIF